MKFHYFDQYKPDKDDFRLTLAINQGYVPSGCLLGGKIVMRLVANGEDPCAGCNGPREKLFGRPKGDPK